MKARLSDCVGFTRRGVLYRFLNGSIRLGYVPCHLARIMARGEKTRARQRQAVLRVRKATPPLALPLNSRNRKSKIRGKNEKFFRSNEF